MGLRVTRLPSKPSRAVGAAVLCCALLAASVPLGSGIAAAQGVEVSAGRIGGADRYETAVLIAERYASEIAGEIDAAVVVSGRDEDAACALAAAALAGAKEAPVLLTEPGGVPLATAGFLARSGITQVFVVGGTSQVSFAVSEQLTQISGAAPTRFDGADCPTAAVAIAQQLGSPRWQPGRGRTALLATDTAVADGLAAGPLAYRARMPLLLARDGVIPPEAASYLDRHTDHVIILGGLAAVSADVERELHGLGLTTQRWSGADRFGTAARIATELLRGEPPASCFNGDGVGLASGRGAADAIASAPLLGERCDPLLLTEPAVLPQVTAAALSSEALGGNVAGALELTIFGGRAAVAPVVEQAALNAAGADPVGLGPPVPTKISAVEAACHWTVSFGEPMLVRDAVRLSSYTFDRQPLTAEIAEIDAGDGTTTAQVRILLIGASRSDPSSEPAGCWSPLAVRNRLGVIAGAIASADGSGVNAGADLIVRADTARPSLSVLAPPGGSTVWVRSSEPLAGGTVTVTLTRSRGRLTSKVTVDDGATGFRVPFSFPSGSYDTADLPFLRSPWLAPGDRISVPAGKLRDRAANLNTASTRTVLNDAVPPSIASAAVSAVRQHTDGTVTADIVVRWSEPIQGCGPGPADRVVDPGALQIDADGDGVADYTLDGGSAAVSLVAAPGGHPSVVPGAAACDQSWQSTVGTLVARLSARSPALLPTAGSKLIAEAGAVHDAAGNANQPHTVAFEQDAPNGR